MHWNALSGAPLERHVRARSGPDVARGGTDDPVVGELLEDVRGPAGDAAEGEGGRHQLWPQPQSVQHRRGEELYVGIEPALDEVRVSGRHRLQPARDLIGAAVARLLGQLVRQALQVVCARVARLVDTVAEAHQ